MTTAEPPFQLKNMYNPAFLEKVAGEIGDIHPNFDAQRFHAFVFDAAWADLELKQRIRHIAHGLRATLPALYPDALGVLCDVTRNMVQRDGERLAFEWGIFPDFVECFGVETPDVSIPALETLTQLASAEFAVRPFLLKYPERMYAQMLLWAEHPSAMVRRLASEGFRPRLPWGMGVPVLKRDPAPILPVLEKLKNDPAETVRRSVANSLNDISKDHPALALTLAQKWIGQSPETDDVVRHALRGLLKKGDTEAMRLLGYEADTAAIYVRELSCTPQVRIGERLFFSFTISNAKFEPFTVRLDYIIHYQTLSGKISRKVFKISSLTLGPGREYLFEKSQRFQDFTTRKHYAGLHRLEIAVNGKVMAGTDFMVM